MNRRPKKACSFTLIELMAVVAIIAILAGLILGGAGAVRQRAAARYQMDFGTYPTAINIATGGNQYGQYSTSTYPAAGQVLFTNLWGAANYATTTGGGKQYLNVKPSMVKTSGVNYFIDPWGYAYGYSWSGTNSLYGGAVPDVWSTGGQAGTGTATNRAKWITSWE